MSTDLDTTRIVRSWLRTDEHESADRVLDDVLVRLDTTPQRPSWWPARRSPQMNALTKFAIAAAAVVAIAIVGINLLPRTSGDVGGLPIATPSPSSSPSSSPALSLSPEPSPQAGAFPPAGKLAIGRHTISQGGVKYSLAVATADWVSSGVEVGPDAGHLTKNGATGPNGIWLLSWTIDGVYADPCGHVAAPPAGPSSADLASAVAAIPGVTLVAGPKDVTVGGHPAKHVVISIPEDIGCAPDRFYLWYDDVRCGDSEPCFRWATALGETNRIWIIDVAGKRVWIEAESYKGASADIETEIQGMIDSIQFE